MNFQSIIEKILSVDVIEVVKWLKKEDLLKDKDLSDKILKYKDDETFGNLLKCKTNWNNEDGLFLAYDERFFNEYDVNSVADFLGKNPEIHRDAFKQWVTDRKYVSYDVAVWKLDDLLVDTSKLIDKLYNTNDFEYLQVIYFFKNSIPNADRIICDFLIENANIKLQNVLKTKLKFKSNRIGNFEYSLTNDNFKNFKLYSFTLSKPIERLFINYLYNIGIDELLNKIEIPSNKKVLLCEALPQYWIETYKNSNDKEKFELLKILKNSDKLKDRFKDFININTIEVE